jgi:hypothetical protein
MRAAVIVLCTAVLCALAAAATAHATTVTGRVDSTNATAPRWKDAFLTTSSLGTITATVDWADETANLDLYLLRRNADGTWSTIASSASKTQKPEALTLASAPAGRYRIGVRATRGASDYTLGYTASPVGLPSGSPPPPPFVTLLFSRSEITVADTCVEDDSGVARLDTVVAPALHARGFAGTGTVETGVTRDAGYACLHYKKTLAASWADLARLRDTYGWAFVSHSRSYTQKWSSLTAQQQWDETCGTIVTLENHGHMRADGLFAWPNNKIDATVQANDVDRCFAFNRRYSSTPTQMANAIEPPFVQNTEGLSGGRCHDTALPCSTMNTLTSYHSPDAMASQLASLRAGQWLTIQAYVLVTGSRAGLWDCTSPNWQDHWTSDAERYCWSDYLHVVDATRSDEVVTDPKSVAVAWGRTGYTPPAP